MIIRILIALLIFAAPLLGQTAENVLVVLNEASPESIDVGTYYAGKRGVPESNILRIKTTAEENISLENFERQIDSPIASWLSRNFAQDRILYIVLTKGMPVRITGTSGKDGTVSSVDSELTLLYRKMATGQPIPPAGPIDNPYFLGEKPITEAKQFSHADHDIYLVSRLEGNSITDIKGLIDRGFASSKEGFVLFDGKESIEKKDDLRMQQAGDLVHAGVTGAAIYVANPYSEATVIRPSILAPAYMAGFNLIESYYLAMPSLGWQAIVIGDPLCAAFRTKALTAQEIDKGIDPETELPAGYGDRRLRALSVNAFQKYNINPNTTKLILRSEARLARKDKAGAIQALEEAVARDRRLAAPQLQLASLYEEEMEFDKAIACYRRLLENVPRNPIILNNLAYALAVRKGVFTEAIALAEQAYGLVKENPKIAEALGPSVSDTLGWIYHLAGQSTKAIPYLEEATKSKSSKGEMHLHLAIARAKTANMPAAKAALQRALELDPKLEQREEVKELQARLKSNP
jgi:tetratricopeptide (TPR) repeat protein